MRLLTLCLFSLLLAGCQPILVTPGQDSVSYQASPTPELEASQLCPACDTLQGTETIEALTQSAVPTSTPTPQVLPPTPSVTPAPACAPSFAEYCIENGTFFFDRPVSPEYNQLIDASYRYASTQNGRFDVHHGVEFYNPSGTPVLAVAGGQVVFAGDDLQQAEALFPRFYGNYIILAHATSLGEMYSLYAHLSRILVQVGEHVSPGQVIGEVGASGAAIGSHLHLEIRIANNYFGVRNPYLWLKPLPGTGVLAGQIVDLNQPILKGTVRIQRMENGQISPYAAPPAMEIYPLEMQDLSDGENFALGDLPAGQYRLTYLYKGRVYERYVWVEAGMLTRVQILLD